MLVSSLDQDVFSCLAIAETSWLGGRCSIFYPFLSRAATPCRQRVMWAWAGGSCSRAPMVSRCSGLFLHLQIWWSVAHLKDAWQTRWQTRACLVGG